MINPSPPECCYIALIGRLTPHIIFQGQGEKRPAMCEADGPLQKRTALGDTSGPGPGSNQGTQGLAGGSRNCDSAAPSRQSLSQPSGQTGVHGPGGSRPLGSQPQGQTRAEGAFSGHDGGERLAHGQNRAEPPSDGQNRAEGLSHVQSGAHGPPGAHSRAEEGRRGATWPGGGGGGGGEGSEHVFGKENTRGNSQQGLGDAGLPGRGVGLKKPEVAKEMGMNAYLAAVKTAIGPAGYQKFQVGVCLVFLVFLGH